METKFEKISQFIDKLEKSDVINEEEQTLLLVGGEGRALRTNIYCDNGCTNYSCENSYCTNGGSCHNDDCDNGYCDGSWFN